MNKLNKVQTMRWINHEFDMIDQRILPQKFEYVKCYSASDVSIAIKNMVVRGAPAIGCAAAFGIALESKKLLNCNKELFFNKMNEAFLLLKKSRPTAVNLFWSLKRMKSLLDNNIEKKNIEISALLIKEAEDIMFDDIKTNISMGKHGSQLLKDGFKVLTHCNAGALATAGYGTALGVIRSAVEHGKKISVIADETRPFLQGARLTAWEMIQDNIPVTLITDNMSGYLMNKGEVDCVVVGTDRVAANGDVANKIGTYMLAVLCARHKIPFYVACPLSTIDFDCPNGDSIPIEERDKKEVTGYRDCQWSPDGVMVRNPAFDITPASLVTAIITEKGIIHSPNETNMKELLI